MPQDMGWKITTSIVLAAMATGLFLSGVVKKQPEPLTIQDNYWGRGAKPSSKSKEQTSINSFTVKVSDADLLDIKNRLKNARLFEALEDVGFQNGFNVDYMKELVAYWKDKYDWRKQEAHLNTFPHYKTKIEGIDVHFIHVKPKLKPGQTAKPLLIAHGWPGSVFEFYKIIPMLVDPTNHGGSEEDVFEVIAPSIPGFGFSEMPHKKGFDNLAAAQIYMELMERLGFEKYYVQGGDWGAVITRAMAILKPSAIKGLHTNLPSLPFGGAYFFNLMLGSVAPSLAGLTEEDYNRVYPFGDKLLFMLQETGYMHIQATKPDTVGFGLTDSPVGLAAYILEKFSTATNKDNRELADGGLDKFFTKDELLTDVMIYWWTRSITSSMRFYKEIWHGRGLEAESTPVTVPSGVAAFPNEMIPHVPESWCYWGYPNLVHYTMMPSGGHFAALEEPVLLAQDIRAFVRKVEALEKS